MLPLINFRARLYWRHD